MSYSDITSEQFFAGNGVLTSFSYNQNVPTAAASTIRVTLFDTALGTEVVLINGTHYTLAGVGTAPSGITVTYPIGSSPIPFDLPVTSAQQLLVEIVPATNQPVVIRQGDTFAPVVTEQQWDRIIRMVQNHEDRLERTFKVARGQSAPADGTTVDQTGVKVLLDSDLNFSGTTLDLLFTNWPLFHDSIQLEFVRARPNTSGFFELNPIDTGSVITTNLKIAREFQIGATQMVTSDNNWEMTDVGNGAADQMNGLIIISYIEGNLTGTGLCNQGDGIGFGGTQYYFTRTSVGARWDGIRITHENGLFSGSFRLWGLPRQ